jgi:hypothetical protein
MRTTNGGTRRLAGGREFLLAAAACSVILAGACDKKAPAAKPGVDSATTVSRPATGGNGMGGVELVDITTTGYGNTRDDAIRDAVVRAVEQVHGRAISVANVSRDLGSIERTVDSSVNGVGGTKSERLTRTRGGKQLSESTRGFVSSIKIVDEQQSGSKWTIKLVASVARYAAPNNKLGVVVGAPKGVNGVMVDEASGGMLRDAVGSALLASPGLALLDRSADPTVGNEAASLSGDMVKGGQQQVADLVVQLTVSALRVNRNARMMRTTNREIVQYDGQVAASYRVVHVATGQVLASGDAQASRASDEALRDNVNPAAWKQEMLSEVAGKLAAGIVDALVPMRIIDVTPATDPAAGVQATVNAGRGRLSPNERYEVVILGAPLKDPTSGEVLGRRERPCCSLTVSRVDERLSYGTLDQNPALAADEVLQVRRRNRN